MYAGALKIFTKWMHGRKFDLPFEDSNTNVCESTYFNMRPEQQVAAGLNMLKTLFVMAALVYGALGFLGMPSFWL